AAAAAAAIGQRGSCLPTAGKEGPILLRHGQRGHEQAAPCDERPRQIRASRPQRRTRPQKSRPSTASSSAAWFRSESTELIPYHLMRARRLTPRSMVPDSATYALSACSRSAIRSSLSSMPIDSRTISGAAPDLIFAASSSWLWVVEAG